MATITTVRWKDDVTGEIFDDKPEGVSLFEFTHPATGIVYLVETTQASYDNFVKEIAPQQLVLDQATADADEAYQAAVKKAQEARDKALEKARTGMTKVIDRTAPANADWQPKVAFGKPVRAGGGSSANADPVTAARSKFIKSVDSLKAAVGDKAITKLIEKRQESGRGAVPAALQDWLNTPEILKLWHPDYKTAQTPATADAS